LNFVYLAAHANSGSSVSGPMSDKMREQ